MRSLRTVDVQLMVESNVLDSMINTFLSSSEKIMQTTYTQILRISESIAENNKDGAFLLKILFNTMKIMQKAQSKVF